MLSSSTLTGKCWDCGQRAGITPAVCLIDGTIVKICVKCTNRWRPYMTRYTGERMDYETESGARVTEPGVVK
jgi:hypothetical protein